MKKGAVTLSFKEKALHEAGWFTNELWKATGHAYKARAYTLGRHFVAVRDESAPKDVMFFSGTTWRDVYWNIKDAWDAYTTVTYAKSR